MYSKTYFAFWQCNFGLRQASTHWSLFQLYIIFEQEKDVQDGALSSNFDARKQSGLLFFFRFLI
jgi:hypothetical protein